MKRVKDKVAIVTGGALGIGRACCILLAEEGAKVAITDVKRAEGEALAKQIQQDGGIAEFWMMDTTRENEIKKTFTEIENKFSGIDILINNAGISGIDKPTHEISEADWDKVINVNVKGVFFCTKHVIHSMKKEMEEVSLIFLPFME